MNDIRDGYDANAELYASRFLHELDNDGQSRRWLDAFAMLAEQCGGPVADLGCGPGGVVKYLSELGLTAIGYDISPGQIQRARTAFPDLDFREGDLAALDHADRSLGGIVSKYSLIHTPPARFDNVFAEWMRVLEPGAPLFVSFFGSLTAEAHGTPFDHTVVTAYELWPAAVGRRLQDAGFTEVEIETSPIPEGGRPFDHATMLARKPKS